MTNKEKQIIEEFETNYTCEWRWKREAHLKPSAGDFLLQALKSQREEIVEKIKNTGAWKDKKVKWILEEIISIITKEDGTK